MLVFSARVRGGAIVPEGGVTLRFVACSLRGELVGRASSEEKRMAKEWPAKNVDEDATGLELTAEQEAELAESIAEADRGDVMTAEELLERLRP